jgi:hypothetical protein
VSGRRGPPRTGLDVSRPSAVDADGLDELQRSFRDLPAELIRELITAMAKNPALLHDETPADLASILSTPNLEGLKALHMATHEKT